MTPSSTMRAVIADTALHRYALATAGRLLPRGVGRRAGWGPGGVVRLVPDLPVPPLPSAGGWVRVTPELAGVCGSDLGIAMAKDSPRLSAFWTSPRQVLGHEVVGVVTETGRGAGSLREGDRVVVDPVIACAQRGFEDLCRQCAEGHPGTCQRFDQPGTLGCVSPGIGFDLTVGGGWSESLVAHKSLVYPVGDIPARRAVLAEPASICLHAALRWKRNGDRVVVIGPGTVGLLVTAALRMLHPDLDIAVVAPGEFGGGKAMEVGASRLLPAGNAAIETLAQSDGGRLVRPRPPMQQQAILEQGVDAVFDCVGVRSTIDLGMRMLRPTGMLVLVGAAGLQMVDWSLVWARQLTIQGTINSGPEPALDGRTAFSQVVEWLADPEYRIDGIVTHEFPLEQFRDALSTAAAGPAAGAVKVTFRP
ncbi:MAG: alcohol dehydrogenase catalytic domain-containing protein [Actinomycetia bacterium]|nr:alcohol dehydrogenase catalytic domain-containing protein [Actinomycetes bacterium]